MGLIVAIREWLTERKRRQRADVILSLKNSKDPFDRMCYDVLYSFTAMNREERQRAILIINMMGCTVEEAAEAIGKFARGGQL